MISKLSRKKAHREHTLSNLAASVIIYERVTTTTAKAKMVAPLVNRLINTGKSASLSSRRRLLAQVFEPKAVQKILEVLADRYKSREGGYTRIIRLGFRLGDGAEISTIELIDAPAEEKVVEESTDDADQTKTAEKKQDKKSDQEAEKTTAVEKKAKRVKK